MLKKVATVLLFLSHFCIHALVEEAREVFNANFNQIITQLMSVDSKDKHILLMDLRDFAGDELLRLRILEIAQQYILDADERVRFSALGLFCRLMGCSSFYREEVCLAVQHLILRKEQDATVLALMDMITFGPALPRLRAIDR